MSDTGTLASVTTDDGFTVTDNSSTADEMRENFEAEPKPLDGDGEAEERKREKAAKSERSEAAAKLGKAGGEAAAKAREAKDRAEGKPDAKRGAERILDDDEADEDKGGDPRKSARARVMEATREAAQARREAAELRERIARIEAERQTPARPASKLADEQDSGPTPREGESYEDYIERRAEWRAERKVREALAEAEERSRQEQATRSHVDEVVQQVGQFHERVKAAREADPDVVERIDQRLLNLTPSFMLPPGQAPQAHNDFGQELVRSPLSMELMQYFTEHPNEANDIVIKSRNAVEIARKVALVEAKLSRSEPAPAREAPISRAKPPVRPVRGSSAAPDDELDPDTADVDAWIAAGNARDQRARRGR